MYKKPDADEVSEKSILAGILHYGTDAYLDVADILTPRSFTKSNHIAIYECIKHIYDGPNEVQKIDPPTLLSAAKETGYSELLTNSTEVEYLKKLFNVGSNIEFNTIRNLAGKIRKLEIANDIQRACHNAAEDLGKVNGTESVDEILSIAETEIGKEIEKLFGQSSLKTQLMGEGVDAFVQNLIDNPTKNFGIPGPYAQYNKDIGGGHIRKELDIIAARAKKGKSLIADNTGIFVASQGIPVLNIDTELSQEQHWIRLLSMLSGISMEDIKTGEFAKTQESKEKVLSAKEKLKEMPYYYECVGGKNFEEILSIMRRWVQKTVGLNDDGTRKNCLIIYDYIKLLNEDGLGSSMQEYQKLGFLVTSLKNFLIRYDVACLAFAQLNRDGIDSNATSSVAGSDRLLMYCSSLTFFKEKTPEEIEEDGKKHGSRKLFVVAARNGPGTDDGDYINMIFDKTIARISEGKRASELKAERADKEAFGYEGDGDDEGPILI